MTKREVIRRAWEVATGRSPYEAASVYSVGRGWRICEGPLNEIPRPCDEGGVPMYMLIRHDGGWDRGEHQATQADIRDYLFGSRSCI